MKNCHLIIIFFALLFCNNLSAQNWRTATPYNGRINDIVFTDSRTGYACGQGAGIGNCSGTGLIIKTIDGGTTWTRMNTITTVELKKIFFVDAFTGWAMGDISTVLKTTDGGITWTQQTSGVGAGLNDIFFVNSTTGFICGLNGILRKTVNGGTTFTTIGSGVTSTIYGVEFVNANTGFIIGNNGLLSKTSNCGTSFTNISPSSDSYRDIQFLNVDTGFVLSNNKIFKTINNGNSWTVYNAPAGAIMIRFHFVNAKIGYIIGDSGLLMKTTDGGNTWNDISVNTSDLLRSIYFSDENTGYYGRSYGLINKTIDGGNNWTSVLSGLSDEIMSIQFRSRALGVAAGQYGEIYHSKNGGLNWTTRDVPPVSFLKCIRWISDKKVIAVGADGKILRSNDTGLSWNVSNTFMNDTMYDIHVLDSLSIYITYGRGKILKSFDGGNSWDTTSNTNSIYPLSGVYFLNKDTGFVCGANEIYRTYNAGISWSLKNDSVDLFSTSFNDIYFTSKDTGYVAGTFGKMYRTINGGEWWVPIYPPPSGNNASINEIQFLNNDTGYFAGSTSQRATFNAAALVTVQPTYCLANNWETHSISMPSPGYGYCAGGQSGLLHTLQKDSLLSVYLQDSIFCSGSKIFVGYLASGLLASLQVLNVELSNANGSFVSPTIIGTFPLYTPIINPSGIATCTLPSGLNGIGYRIRIVCNNPSLVSPDNGFDLTIKSSVVTDVSLQLINTKICINDTLIFTAFPIAGGSIPVYTWSLDNQKLDWHSATISFDTLQSNHVLSVVMNSSLSCASNIAYDTLQFNVFQNPMVDAGFDYSICSGDSVLIGVANNSNNLQWIPSNGLSNDTISKPFAFPLSTTSYVLTTTDLNGCIGSDQMIVLVNPLPSISVMGNQNVCEGDSVLLTANSISLNPQFTWTPSPILSNTTGSQVYATPVSDINIYATITDNNSCTNIDSINIHLIPLGALPTLAIVGNSIVVTGNTTQLSWYLNDTLITNFTNDTLMNPANGSYVVQSTDSNGCSISSVAIIYSINGIAVINQKNSSVFYDDGILHLNWKVGNSKNTSLKLFDVSGRLIYQQSLILNADGVGEAVLKNITKGIYFVMLNNDEKQITLKFIVD